METELNKKAPYRIIRGLVTIYMFAIAVIYPFLYNGIGIKAVAEDKWQFLVGLSLWFRLPVLPDGMFLPGIFLLSALAFAWLVRTLQRDRKLFNGYFSLKNLSATDISVLAYAALTIISTLFSPYKDLAVSGIFGFNMGLVAQLMFVAAYFLVSRFWDFDDIQFDLLLASSAGVFLIGLLNRFGQDPFGMYRYVIEAQKPFFLSTIGQTTWYTSFVCTVCPLGVFAFWQAGRKRARALSGLYVALAAATIVTANADSAFAGLAAMLALLLYMSLDSDRKMMRFMEALIIILASWRLVGVMRLILSGMAAPLDTMGEAMSGGAWGWAALILCVPVWMHFRKKASMRGSATDGGGLPEWVKKAYPFAVIVPVALTGAYIALNTAGLLPEAFRSGNNYLLFNNDWGHFRGAIWTDTFASLAMAMKDTPWQLMTGAGPGCFFSFAYERATSNIDSIAYAAGGYMNENAIVGTAHNEWLNMLVCGGVPGFVAYAGIFLTSAWRMAKARGRRPECLAVALCIASYMAHNFFCYQQCICTIYIFIFMGCGEAMLKRGLPDDVRNHYLRLANREKARAGAVARGTRS